ncbi:hypothetical protein SD51_09140 [Alicyclobacillus tengchongensis]|nr:hypothetical protein SD51_09140 [Alicyclobacillus tengchongensis]
MRSVFRFTSELDDVRERVHLTDLAVVLSRDEHVRCEFGPVSVWREEDGVLQITTAYQGLTGEERMACTMADVYLRAAGSKWFTDRTAMIQAKAKADATGVPMLVWQFMCAVEDVRIVARLTRQRPGTAHNFASRTAFYRNLFTRQIPAWERDGRLGNVCFAELYNGLTDPTGNWYALAAGCPTSEAAALLALRVVQERLAATNQPMVDLDAQWFDYSLAGSLQVGAVGQANDSGRDRADRSAESALHGEDSHEDQTMPAWTQRQDSNRAAGLQMDDAEGATQTGGGWSGRLGSLQQYEGTSRRGRIVGEKREDGSEIEVREAVHESAPISDVATKAPRVIERGWHPPSREAMRAVQFWKEGTKGAKRRLLRAFYHSFWREQNALAGGFQYGRLGRRLERVATERWPRLFEHRRRTGLRHDAAVQVLVDCSGSMEPYLDACKPALYLLADTLRTLRVPYSVCAFWEDSVHVVASGEGETATFLWDVIPFARSQASDAALALVDLEPQLDNRDGFAIRLAAQRLNARGERQKWLFVVSDGQPAAEDYRDAIADTKRAIRWARSRGMQVLHLCIADPQEPEFMQAIRHLYGRATVVIRDASEIGIAMEKALAQVLRHLSQGE